MQPVTHTPEKRWAAIPKENQKLLHQWFKNDRYNIKELVSNIDNLMGVDEYLTEAELNKIKMDYLADNKLYLVDQMVAGSIVARVAKENPYQAKALCENILHILTLNLLHHMLNTPIEEGEEAKWARTLKDIHMMIDSKGISSSTNVNINLAQAEIKSRVNEIYGIQTAEIEVDEQ